MEKTLSDKNEPRSHKVEMSEPRRVLTPNHVGVVCFHFFAVPREQTFDAPG